MTTDARIKITIDNWIISKILKRSSFIYEDESAEAASIRRTIRRSTRASGVSASELDFELTAAEWLVNAIRTEIKETEAAEGEDPHYAFTLASLADDLQEKITNA